GAGEVYAGKDEAAGLPPGGRWQKVHDGERGHRLPAARLADEADGLAAAYVEAHAAHCVEGSARCADRDGEILHIEYGLGRRGCSHHPLPSGANTSRSPSPSRLMPSTSSASAVPGIAMSQNEKNIMFLASAIMRPQDGSGGCTPRPRNDRAASSRMALPASTVATTIRSGKTFGRTSPVMIRRREAPAASAAAT